MLYNGNKTMLDDEDYDKLSNYKYYENNRGYAYRNLYENKKVKAVYLHREVINAPSGFNVDHINGNKLDNRKENLRLVTPQQNSFNLRKTQKKTSSLYKGVSWDSKRKGWLSNIRVNQKNAPLGLYKTEESAALAYNEAAKMHFGEYALLNEVPYDPEWKSQLIPNRRDGIGKSKYKGVSYRPKYDDWQCHIMVNYKSIFLGTFKDEVTAAKTYNEAAIKYRGEKAKLNDI